jgi:transcriptional regulator with XRE-family HTH domain
MPTLNYKIANKIRKLRELKGFSQEAVSVASELSLRQYQRMEAGEADLKLSNIEKICHAIEIQPEQLFGFDEKYFFENNTSNIGKGELTVDNVPNVLINQFQDQIAVLKNEVQFLRQILSTKS